MNSRIQLIDYSERHPLDTKITIDGPSVSESRPVKAPTSGGRAAGYEQLNDVSIEMEDLGTPVGEKGKHISGGHRQTEAGAHLPRKSMINMVSSDQIKNYTQQLIHRELTPLVVFGLVSFLDTW